MSLEMRAELKVLLVLIGLLLTACSKVSDHSAAFRVGLDDARAENTRHAAACGKVATMAAMKEELNVHAVVAEGAFVRMTAGLNTMTEHDCRGLSELQEAVDDFHMEETEHRVGTANLTEAEQARSECISHTAVLREQLDTARSSIRACTGE